tara:strand:- start:40 stop:531 length:492 start_codon:yes stop_codon:yes gene_type:complete
LFFGAKIFFFFFLPMRHLLFLFPFRYIFQGVGMLFSGGFSTLEWGPDEERECRFVFIGRNLDRDALMAGVNACRVDNKPLRFKVGDAVKARVGDPNEADEGFKAGTIIAVWDEGNPYRIELELNGTMTEVWGPKDDDAFVRADVSVQETKEDGVNKRQKIESE